MNSDRTPSWALRIAGIAAALCLAVGQAIRPGFIAPATAMRVWRRIARIRGLLLALEARLLAGRRWGSGRPPGACDATPRSAGAAGCEGRDDGRLPRRFSWLCGLVPGEAACLAGQLRLVLAEPEMVALLAQNRQAVRILQPLCWMLGIAPDAWVPAPDAGMTAAADAEALRPPRCAVAVATGEVASSPADLRTGRGWLRFIPH